MTTVARQALTVEGVKHASLHRRDDDPWTGIVYHDCGVEFDVRQDGRFWNLNDDEGRNFRARSLSRAIRKAVRGQDAG